MKKIIIIFIVFVLAGIALANVLNKQEKPSEKIPVSQFGAKENDMRIKSFAFESYKSIPSKYTCDGANINPPLSITGVPEGSKSLVLIMDDPDAPGGTWVHWTVWNMDPDLAQIEEGTTPQGIEGKTSFGKPGYGGPCPPTGRHRYYFKLYALDTKLDLPASSEKSDIEEKMLGHINASTELVGFYGKVK